MNSNVVPTNIVKIYRVALQTISRILLHATSQRLTRYAVEARYGRSGVLYRFPLGHDASIVRNKPLSTSTSRLPNNGSITNSKMRRRSAVKALGEVALRINNLERMKRFYQEVLGFEVLGEFPAAALLKIGIGSRGSHPGARII